LIKKSGKKDTKIFINFFDFYTVMTTKEELRIVNAGEEIEKYTREDIGNKAIGLMYLYNLQNKYGFKVPEFFIISTDFFKFFSREVNLEKKINDLKKLDDEYYIGPMYANVHIQELFESFGERFASFFRSYFAKLSNIDRIKKEIKEFWEKNKLKFHLEEIDLNLLREENKILSKIHNLIYRSSSPLEDDKFSFAGVFLSEVVRMNIFSEPIDNVALSYVLSSLWSPYAEYYIRKHGLQNKKREMAVIIQRFSESKYKGFVYCIDDQIIIKYKEKNSKNYSIVRYSKDKLNKFENPENYEKLDRKKLTELYYITSGLMREISTSSMNLPFTKNFCLEFLLDNQGTFNLVQIRNVPEGLIKNVIRISEYLPKIDKSKIICHAKRGLEYFSVGEISGPAINLLDYNFDKGYHKKIKKLDQMYKGAIYIVDPHGAFGIINRKEVNPHSRQVLFHMLTPNKRGIIVCSSDDMWEHLHNLYLEDNTFLIRVVIKEKDFALRKIKTGEKISIYSNGNEAIVYYP